MNKPLGSWGVITEMPMHTCNCLVLRQKRSTSCIFTFVSSSLKDKMHFTCQTGRLANASGQMGNFTPLGLRKIEFYG